MSSCNKLIEKIFFWQKIPPLWECLSFSCRKYECCFIRSPHPEVFFNEIWSIHRKVFFRSAVLNIFVKLATQLIFSIVVSFQHIFCQGWFSRNFLKIFRATFSKNTASETFLILRDCSLKVSRTPFYSLTACGNGRFVCRSVSVCVCPFVTTNIKGLMNTTA